MTGGTIQGRLLPARKHNFYLVGNRVGWFVTVHIVGGSLCCHYTMSRENGAGLGEDMVDQMVGDDFFLFKTAR